MTTEQNTNVAAKPVEPAHLTRQFERALGVGQGELKLKHLSLNSLMTAFSARVSEAGLDETVTLEVPALARHYADKLAKSQFVVFYDPDFARDYFVKAVGNHLLAFYYTQGPWYNHYSVLSSSPTLLEELDIVGHSIRDTALIDRVFGFDLEVENEKDVVTGKMSEVKTPVWDWHHSKGAAKKEVAPVGATFRRGNDQRATQPAGAVKTVSVHVPVKEVESVGAPAPTEHRIEAELNEPQSQFARAFADADARIRNGGKSNRQAKRDARRHDNQPQQPRTQQQQPQPQAQAQQTPQSVPEHHA